MALLSACGAGQNSQTSEVVPAVQGVSASAGPVTVADAMIVFPPRPAYPAGSDAPLSLVITNGSLNDDTLVSARSDAASAVVITPAATGTTPPPLGCVRSPYEPGQPPSPAATPDTTTIARTIPNGGTVIMTAGCPHLLLVGLKRDLTLLDTVALRLTFASAGPVDLMLPVHTANSPLPRQVVPGFDPLTGETTAPNSSP
jgi:copper(I)-binding protein